MQLEKTTIHPRNNWHDIDVQVVFKWLIEFSILPEVKIAKDRGLSLLLEKLEQTDLAPSSQVDIVFF